MPKDLDIPTHDHRIPPPGYRVQRKPTIDEGTRRLALIAAGIAGIAIVVFGLSWMLSGRTSGVPVVAAPTSAMRVKPANPGGMQIAGTSAPILTGKQSNGAATLAPGPETPDLAALNSPPPATNATPAAAPSPAKTAGIAGGADQTGAKPGSAVGTSATANAAPAPGAEIAANGLPLPPPTPPVRLAALAPAQVPPAAHTGPRERTATPEAGTGRATEVQLAALSSPDAATREWQELQAALPGLFDQRQPLITKVNVDGHTFWRLRTGGFADVAAASEFCKTVKAKGKSCTIAAF